MGGLFQRARNFFEGLAPPPPPRAQSFSVQCPEGHRLTGARTEGYQALRCPTCGEGVFVLPRSPLPDPAAPPSKSRTRPAEGPPRDEDEALIPAGYGAADGPVALTDPPATGPGDDDDADGVIEWVDDDEGLPAPPTRAYSPADPTDFAAAEIDEQRQKNRPATPDEPGPAEPEPGAGARGKRGKDAPRSRTRERGRPPERRAREPAVQEAPRRSAADWVREHRNPLIFGTVALLVVGTVALRVRNARRQDLPRVAERGRTEGIAALDEGKFDAAMQLLSPARRAVESLGGGYDPAAASAVRQAADEVAVITDLAPDSLEAMLDEASRADPKEWESRFNLLYKGKAVIVEDQFQEVPGAGGRGRYDLYYRVFRPGEGSQPGSVGRIDLDGFKLVADRKARVDDYVIFGARLSTFRYDLSAEEWLIGLEPDSGVVMTHRKALDALNWPGPAGPDAAEPPR